MHYFNKNEQSVKDSKCSWNETNISILLNIANRYFFVDTADDSIHSDGNITIRTRNEITSKSIVHADQNLIFGKKIDNSLSSKNITKN